jgi:O-6-methylguanine DNA methyltransferase
LLQPKIRIDACKKSISDTQSGRSEKCPDLKFSITPELQEDQRSLQRELDQIIAFIETRSYSDVARDSGVPEAVRAVAGACAANVLAVAIPCHRVIRGDGTISGYRWGVDRKRALLEMEAQSSTARSGVLAIEPDRRLHVSE